MIDDVRKPNEVLKIHSDLLVPVPAAVWIFNSHGSVGITRAVGLQQVVNLLFKGDEVPEMWLPCAHRAPQPANRITRWAGLWKSLERRGMNLPLGRKVLENVIEDGNTLRGFGALQLEGNNMKNVAQLMEREHAVLVVVPPGASGEWIPRLVRSGWSCDVSPSKEPLSQTFNADSALLHVFGEFDDREVVVALIGKKAVLRKLLSYTEGTSAS